MFFFLLFFFVFFSFLFRKKSLYDINVSDICDVTVCMLSFNPIMVDNYDFKLFTLVGWGWSFLSVAWPSGVQLVFFFCS